MKILYCNRTLYPYEGGADISALTLLENLSKKHEIIAVYIGKELENKKIKCYLQNLKEHKGIWINLYFLNKSFTKVLDKIVNDEKPDLIISQDYLIPASVQISKEYGIKSIIFLRNYFHLSIDGFRSYLPDQEKFGRSIYLTYQVQYPFYNLVVKKFQKALKDADLVCSVSNYVEEITLKYLGIKSEVIRPFVFSDDYKVEIKDNFICYINPDLHKGLEIFEKIAEKLPEKKFLVVGKKYIPKTKNIEAIEWVNDMKKIYEKTRLILMPAIWPDPCPRVGIESMCSGIPIIASNRGGQIEEADQRGIIVSDIFNIDEWIKAIRKFDDEDFYKLMSKNSRFKAIEFGEERQFAKFNLLLSKLFK